VTYLPRVAAAYEIYGQFICPTPADVVPFRCVSPDALYFLSPWRRQCVSRNFKWDWARPGPLFLLWRAAVRRRHVHADKACARDRGGDETRGTRLVEETVHDRKPRGFALRHDHRLLDAIEIVRHQPQARRLLRGL